MKYIFPVLLVLFGFTPVGMAVESDSLVIERVNRQLTENFAAGDTTGMASLYASDAVMLPPSSEILKTTSSIKSYWDDLKQKGVREYAIYPIDLVVEGDRAYASGIWEATRESAEGRSFNMNGNITNVLEKQPDGSWKITMQSWY